MWVPGVGSRPLRLPVDNSHYTRNSSNSFNVCMLASASC